MVLLIISAVFILLNKLPQFPELQPSNIKFNSILIILNLLLLSIVIRSFIGISITLDWKENIIFLTLLTLAVVSGKMFGGIIADKFGWLKVTVLALIVSSPLIAFGINHPLLYITGIFFFNFTMPVTLSAISNMLRNREGYAFGLTTLALIIGTFPCFAGINFNAANSPVIFAIISLSAIFIYFGLRNYSNLYN